MKRELLLVCLTTITGTICGCGPNASGPADEVAEPSYPTVDTPQADDDTPDEGTSTDGVTTDAVPLAEFTPLETPDGFLPLTPRTHTAEEAERLIGEQLKFVSVSGGFGEVYVRMTYGPELNLNPGPPGMRPTSEGGSLSIQGTVHLKDGTTIPAGPKASSSQTWQPEDGTFLDSRGLKIEGEAKTRDIEKITGEVTLTLPVDTTFVELTPASPADTEVVEGLVVTPNWKGHSIRIDFAEGSRRKIIHVRGIDASGQELLITSIGSATAWDDPQPGFQSVRFAPSEHDLARVQFFAAPEFIERVVPFELAPE